jgi:hypothetical protein
LHPALHSWREELPSTLVRFCAYLSGLAVMSITAAQFFQSTPVIAPIKPVHRSQWISVERPIPAFALDIPEAASMPARYAIRRHAAGGRLDIFSLGDVGGAAPFLQVEIYRPGDELAGFAAPQDDLARHARGAGPVTELRAEDPLASKFGPLSIAAYDLAAPEPRHCLGFLRDFDDPPLQLSGRFCQSGSFVERATLACALDRLTLLAAASEPKVGALFAQAERNRHFCGERDPIIARTPKHKLLWQALANRPEPRRVGR